MFILVGPSLRDHRLTDTLDFRLKICAVLSMLQKQARYQHVHVDGKTETQREKLRIVVQREESTRESHRPCPTFHHSSPSRSLSSSLLGGISEKQPVSRVQAILYIQCCSLLIQSFSPLQRCEWGGAEIQVLLRIPTHRTHTKQQLNPSTTTYRHELIVFRITQITNGNSSVHQKLVFSRKVCVSSS